MIKAYLFSTCAVVSLFSLSGPAAAQMAPRPDGAATDAPAPAVQAGGTSLAASPNPAAGSSGAVTQDNVPLETPAAQGGLADIVVTAQKRSENVQRVPIAVSVVTPLQLAAAGVTTTQDLAAAVPGLQLLNIANNVTPRLRGVGTGSAAAGIEGAVATYVDGVYYAYGADVILDLSDVSQVSVIKGPQGTLFGRNATGGVLQITTRDPTQQFHANLATSLDNYLTSRSDVYVSGGLTQNVAAGLSLQYTTQGRGWGKNLFDGSDTYKINHAFTARGKIKWDVDDRTTVRLQGDFTTRAGPTAANFRPFPGYNSIHPTPQSSRAWNVDNALDTTTSYSGGGGSLNIEHDLGFAKLTSISAYRQSQLRFDFSPGVTAVPTLNILVPENSRQFTQELQLVSPSGGRFNWTVGAFYFYNRAQQRSVIDFFNDQVAPFSQIIVPALQHANSVAGFGQGTYRITAHTRLTAGFRYTYEKKDFVGQDIGVFPDGTPLVLAATPGPNMPGSIVFKKPTWRLSLDQDLADHVVGYVSYNRGIKSGGFNVREPANPPFKPEQLDAYEAGVKSEALGRRLRLNLAGFYYDYKNIQVPIYGATLVIVNGAAARIYGADADLVANLTEQLSVNASATWLHARFTSFKQAPFSIPNPGNDGATLIKGDASGNTLPYSPSFTSTVGVNYKVPSSVGNFIFNVTDNYNSGFFGEADNRLHQGSYHFLNASVNWTSSNSNLSARLYINNILDKAVVSQVATLATGYIADYSNPPRIFGGSVQLAF